MPIVETAQLTRSQAFPPVRPASNNPQGALPRADGELIALQNIGTKLPFNHNQTIFNEGDPAEHAYKVLSGSVRLCNHLADGRRRIVQFLFPGYLFSFMELAGHSLTAEAINDVILISYPQHQIIHLGVQDPSLRERFVALTSQWLHMMHGHLMLLGRQATLERESSCLLSPKERMGAEEGDALEIPMSRQDIADYLGLTIRTVYRVLPTSTFSRDRHTQYSRARSQRRRGALRFGGRWRLIVTKAAAAKLNFIRLELARTPEFPQGSSDLNRCICIAPRRLANLIL